MAINPAELRERIKAGKKFVIRRKLIKILTKESGVPADEILDTSRLGTDLGIGKVIGNGEFLELKEKIEGQFRILIPESILPTSDRRSEVTVGEIVSALYQLLTDQKMKVTQY